MRIECTSCEMYRSDHCDDCLVTALLKPGSDVMELDEALDPPLQALSSAGLIPVLKFRPRRDPEQSNDRAPTDRPEASSG